MKRSIISAVCIIIAFGLLLSVTFGLVILSSVVKELLVFLLLAFQVVAIILIVLFIFLFPFNKDDED